MVSGGSTYFSLSRFVMVVDTSIYLSLFLFVLDVCAGFVGVGVSVCPFLFLFVS